MFKSLLLFAIALAGPALERHVPTGRYCPQSPSLAAKPTPPARKVANSVPKPPQKPTVQVLFTGVAGVSIASGDLEPIRIPGRLNLEQCKIHRLKLSVLPGHEKLELFPTLEIAPLTPSTETYTADRAIEARISDKDLTQVMSGNYLTKVMYLADREFQDAAGEGMQVMSSADLAADADPIVEADRRGTIIAILRFTGSPPVRKPARE